MVGCPSCRQAFALIHHNNESKRVNAEEDLLLIYSGSMRKRMIVMADEREELIFRLWLDHGIVMFLRAYTIGQSVTKEENARLFQVILNDYHDITRDTVRLYAFVIFILAV